MEPTPEQMQAMRDAEAARRVLEDPLVAGALDAIEQQIIGLWTDLPVEKKEQAEELKRLLAAAKQFRAVFTVKIGGGDIARSEILAHEHMQSRMQANLRKLYG